MIGDFRYHSHVRTGAGQDGRIDPLHVARDQADEPIDQGGLVTFERNDDGQQNISQCRSPSGPPRGSAKHSAAHGLVNLPDKHRNTDRPRQAPTVWFTVTTL